MNELAKKIRGFECEVERLYRAGKIKGSAHLSIGQEEAVVDIIGQLKDKDIVCSNHRCHHHYLALTQDFKGLLDELQGLPTGVNQGRALSQHIHIVNRFYANGMQGGLIPIACGMAMAFKRNKQDRIVFVFIGDGTLGQGVLYESLNIASLWQLPIVFILENNQYAMSTHISQGVAGSIKNRFRAFGLQEADKNNIRGITPAFLVIETERFCGHSCNDPQNYRNKNGTPIL